MVWVAPGERQFRFVVTAVAAVPPKGTLATGVVKEGDVRVGDKLTILHGSRLTLATCRGIETHVADDGSEDVDRRTLGLWFGELRTDAIGEGDEIVSSERVPDDA